jgi:hypothetical protein
MKIEKEIPSLKKVRKLYYKDYCYDLLILLFLGFFFVFYSLLIIGHNHYEFKINIHNIFNLLWKMSLLGILLIDYYFIASKLLILKEKKVREKTYDIYLQIEKEYCLLKEKHIISEHIQNILEIMIQKKPIVKNILTYLQIELENDKVYRIQKDFQNLNNNLPNQNQQSKTFKI